VAAVPGSAAAGSLPDSSLINTLRITRTPVGDTPLEVRCALTAFGSAGAVDREQVVTIPAGSAHADVPFEPAPAGRAGRHEIVTLTLLDDDGYRVARPSATLFLAGSPRSCSEAALFEAYRRGESPEAFAALVERNRPAVFRTCYRVLGNWHDAEDVSQLVFLALAQRQVQLQIALAAWLRTVARNVSIMFLRSRSRRSRHEHRAARPLQVASGEPSQDLREELDAALTRLPGPLGDAVRLRYLEGLSQLEAAEALGCPRGTLSQRAAHGVRRLRGLLGERNNGAAG
jgi:RNA polymerase sigma-70 factor (ECF subfamily)